MPRLCDTFSEPANGDRGPGADAAGPTVRTMRGGEARMGRFGEFRSRIRQLPPGPLNRSDLVVDDFRIAKEGRLSVYYAPFDAVNPDARLTIVGLTPGWTQMRAAFEAARDALIRGSGDLTALRRAKETAAFAGSMRTNLVAMLDDLDVPHRLDLKTTASLFDTDARLLHATSALRYPVFVDGRNYAGSPSPTRTPMLASFQDVIAEELGHVSASLVVPLGKATTIVLSDLVDRKRLDGDRVLLGFPHPSGANAHRVSQFASNRTAMEDRVASWFG